MPNQQNMDDLEFLAQVSKLWTEVDINYALKQVVKLSATAVGAVRASLFLNHDHKLQLENFIVADGEFTVIHDTEYLTQILTHGLAGWVLRHGEGVLIEDTNQDSRWYHLPDVEAPARSALSVPLHYDKTLLGVMTFAHTQSGYFTAHHLRLLMLITHQIALAVHNAKSFRQINAQRQQLTAILRAIPDILLVLDGTNTIILASNAIESVLQGEPVNALIGQPLAYLVAKDPIFQHLEVAITRAKTSAQPQNIPFEVRSELNERDFFVHLLPRQNVAGYIIVMNDVTMLRNLSRFKDTTIKMLSHDLRTPLIVMTGYANLLSDDLKEDPVDKALLQQYIDGILHASERMEKLLNNMLMAGSVRDSASELHELVNLKTLVFAMLREIRPFASQKNIRLKAKIERDRLATIHGDAILLQQAMENFVSNAIKYTPEGGKVSIHTYNENDRFYFVVRDTGIGIQEAEQPLLFQSYFRSQDSLASKNQGIGLGLSLVKNVITQHGGDVWVESAVGKGSTFGFWLPLSATDAAK